MIIVMVRGGRERKCDTVMKDGVQDGNKDLRMKQAQMRTY